MTKEEKLIDDLISRQSAMFAFAKRVKDSNNSDFVPAPSWNDAVFIIEKLPNVERRGQWVKDCGLFKCSTCGKYQGIENALRFKYCPYCGAIMEFENEVL